MRKRGKGAFREGRVARGRKGGPRRRKRGEEGIEQRGGKRCS